MPPKTPKFAQLHFLTGDPAFSDYRPAIDATAQHVVFERTPINGDITSLYILNLLGGTPTPFIKNGGGIFTGPSQTRPDWSWVTGNVSLNVAKTNKDSIQILITDTNGNPLQNVLKSQDYAYPTWSPDGRQLIVDNNSKNADPHPCTSLIALDGSVAIANLNGHDDNGVPMFAGFAAPTPGNVELIAYAGQPAMTWGPQGTDGYSENYNYVFINVQSSGEFRSAPLEPNASITVYEPVHQGRAPVWSPDGKHIAFESDRAGRYAIFLANVAQRGDPMQITDAAYGAQHPKFYPDGNRLVLTARQTPNTDGPRGIAWIDISQYL